MKYVCLNSACVLPGGAEMKWEKAGISGDQQGTALGQGWRGWLSISSEKLCSEAPGKDWNNKRK